MKPIIKRSAITRTGYEYQDLVGIEILINHFRDPNLYEWVKIEGDDENFRALDDVVALRKDGSIELFQVKFTVDSDEHFLDWKWLLEAKGEGSSMLSKWAKSFFRAKSQGCVHRARLVTNRIPSALFDESLENARVSIDKVPKDIRDRVVDACGGIERAQEFFREFEFLGERPDLDRYEYELRDNLVPSDTSSSGWLLLREFVRDCAIHKDYPDSNGEIRRKHLVRIITKSRPQPISQDFLIPQGYQVPSMRLDERVRGRITTSETPITILWAAPGRGKSTYLSHLVQSLQHEGEVVLRHHYFLSSDGPGVNRISYADVAASIMDQLADRHPDIALKANKKVENLHADLSAAAAILAEKGRRLFLVIDGLDHVWRDTSKKDQLDQMFNSLLPLPKNVSLLVGTQRVPDAQLPGSLLANVEKTDWIEVPRMDKLAVHRWLKFQDAEQPMILRMHSGRERSDELANIGNSLFQISRGHPLYLIYAIRKLRDAGKEISTYEIESLPPCPDGDIRSYYKALWIGLPAAARNILHALAGSEFFWPSQGIQECLGDFGEIVFLLESSSAGMFPFHQSIFAYVRDMECHSERYAALLPKIADWLEKQAPEYWRWGWLWLVQAEMGNFEPLFEGVCRDWVVSSLAKGYPERQIARILLEAEAIALEQGDMPQTVKLLSLKTRVLNARKSQLGSYARFQAVALATGDNLQQTLNLADDMQNLSVDDIVSIVKLGPAPLRTKVAEAGLRELSRRVDAWEELPLRQGHEFGVLLHSLLSVAASAGASAAPYVLCRLRELQNPAPHYNSYINLLGAWQDTKALLEVKRRMRGKRCSRQRRLIQEHILRTALIKGANPRPLINTDAADLTPFTASWLVRSARGAGGAGGANSTRFCASLPLGDARGERSPAGAMHGMSRYFYDFFWSAFCISLQARGEFSLLYPSRESKKLGWSEKALRYLEGLARGIATGRHKASYSTVYVAADAHDLPDYAGLDNHGLDQFQAFRRCLSDIALDLHLLGLEDRHQPRISTAEFDLARRTRHWVDEFWIEQNVKNQIPLLDASAANAFIQERSSAISSKARVLDNDPLDQLTQLASLSSLYSAQNHSIQGHNDQDNSTQNPAALTRRAADYVIGYGCSRNLGEVVVRQTLEVLDAIRHVHAADGSRTEEWISTVMPIINEISNFNNFTGGDQTKRVRFELIDTVAATIPGHLGRLYGGYISQEEWSYADKTLEAALSTIDLSSEVAAGLCSTLLDDKILRVLEKRGRNEPIAASLLQKQMDFLARSQPAADTTTQGWQVPRPVKKAIPQQDPTAIHPDNFRELAEMVCAFDFPRQYRAEFFRRWLKHWQARGKASIALDSAREFFDKEPLCFNADDVLDEAFEVSLAEEGREAAYPWLVKANIYRHGWQSPLASEEDVIARLNRVAHIYPERWQDFIQASLRQSPHFWHLDRGFPSGYKYLVRFLLLAGQADIALSVTDELVKALASEIGGQLIPEASWPRYSGDAELACELLFERLNWPAPFVRWRAAMAIRDLLNDAATRESATSLLLRNLEICPTESETCSLLTIILMTNPDSRPTCADITDRLQNPSALSDALLHQIYSTEIDSQTWRGAHSGQAPDDFDPDRGFHGHSKIYVPAIIFHNLKHLESQTGMPFLRQWEFECKQLRDRIDRKFMRHPRHLYGAINADKNIASHYFQRRNEIYRSAYCRALAIAVDQWGIASETAAEYCSVNVPAIAGLFDIDPGKRPAWLSEIPERAIVADSDLGDIVRELVKVRQAGNQRLVSLRTPFRKNEALYGHLSVKAFFATDGFQLGDDNDIHEPLTAIPLAGRFDLRGRQLALPNPPAQEGSEGDAMPVCVNLLPMPFGYWIEEYFSIGVSVPASYCLPKDTVLQCGSSGLELVSAGSTIAFTHVWHDDWLQSQPHDRHMRCGIAAFMDASELAKAQAENSHRLGWAVDTLVWRREDDRGDFKPSKRRAVVIEA